LLAIALSCIALLPAYAETRPNFVVFMVDDLGWTDVGAFGSDLHQTPNVDRLAAEGMRFSDAYAACTVCSPTRAAYMTGKYPARLNVTDWITGQKRPYAKLSVPDWTMRLELGEVTIAEALKAVGYTTCHIGKWHLGTEDYYPEHQGFDYNIAGTYRGAPNSYFSPYDNPNISDGPDGEYLTDREGIEAAKWIATHKDEPFFLSIPFYAVHTPLKAKADKIAKYEALIHGGLNHRNAIYAGMVESMDDAVGAVLKALDEHGLTENTIVIFTSDNGGLVKRLGAMTNVPLRAGKGSAYEGGTRVPFIVRWPGVAEAGSVHTEPIITMDLYPTLLELAGATGDSAHNADVDGKSLASLLRNTGATIDRDYLFWHYPHYHSGGATPYSAVRAGNWRLVEFFEDGRRELYNLRDDLSETMDLAMVNPEKAEELTRALHAWRKSVDAQLPTPNPKYDPAREKEKLKSSNR
jgi:arylsulfatase A-like enzyme